MHDYYIEETPDDEISEEHKTEEEKGEPRNSEGLTFSERMRRRPMHERRGIFYLPKRFKKKRRKKLGFLSDAVVGSVKMKTLM